MHTFVIAEAAATHDGYLTKALRLIDLANHIGADAVKFQWCSNPTRLAQRRNVHEYLQAYQYLKFPTDWFPILKGQADRMGLEFMCTVYLKEDISVVAPFVSRFKIASFEAGDRQFFLEHYRHGKKIIVSAGMGHEPDPVHFDDSVETDDHSPVSFLYCVSAYPTPSEQINLANLWSGNYDGLSDHTLHPMTGACAAAAGASIVEFHYRLWDTSPHNADFKVARNPDEAHRYIDNIRHADLLMGKADIGPKPCEEPMLRFRVSR